MNSIVKEEVFQMEKGKQTGHRHYQGRFELKGPRTGKKQLLNEVKLKRFLNRSTDYCRFQLECGNINNTKHY